MILVYSQGMIFSFLFFGEFLVISQEKETVLEKGISPLEKCHECMRIGHKDRWA